MAQQLGGAPHDGQAQAQAFAAVAFRVAQLMKFPEHALLLGRRNAHAVVPHFNAQLPGHATASDQHAAARGMRDGVADQVAQDAFQQHRVGPDACRAGPHAQRHAFFPGLRRVFVAQLIQQRVQRKALPARFDHAGVQPRQVQQGIKQMAHGPHGAGNVIHQVVTMA
ncbi:hypothetical protein D3C71_1478280 [compost metagenome]